MKKILVALLVGAFGISALAQSSNPSVVYDYKATFKRLDPQYKIRKLDGMKKVVESYAVKSDSITGYIVLPLCEACGDGKMKAAFTDPMTNTPIPAFYSYSLLNNPYPSFSGVGYFVRKDNKLIKNAGIEWVAKTNVWANAAIFGKNAYVIDTDIEQAPFTKGKYKVKNINNAWMALDFGIPDHLDYNDKGYEGDLFIKGITTNKNDDTDNIFVGFLGLDHMGLVTSPVKVINRGFGTVKPIGQSEAYSMGLCGNPTDPGWSCSIIQSISGSMLADVKWAGTCGVTPMWELCDPTKPAVKSTLIAGTWSLKYNKKLTESSDKEGDILKKLKATDKNVKSIYVSPTPPAE